MSNASSFWPVSASPVPYSLRSNSFLVLDYPDGTRVLWYRRLVLEGKAYSRVMLFPFGEVEEEPSVSRGA